MKLLLSLTALCGTFNSAFAFDHSLIDALFSGNHSFTAKLPVDHRGLMEYVKHGEYFSLRNKSNVFKATISTLDYPETYTSGYARVDYIDALTRQFVQASIFELGVCARYRRPVARSFWAPDCCPFVQGMKFRNLIIVSEREATMTFDYFRLPDCSDNNGQPTTARTIVFPTAGGAQPTSTPVPLIYNTYHVPGRPRAIWLPPASRPGYFLSNFWGEQVPVHNCAGRSIFLSLGTSRCANDMDRYGISNCDASGLTTRTYSFTANPTCQGPGTLAWSRPLTCAATVINGVVSSDMQTVKCLPEPARRV